MRLKALIATVLADNFRRAVFGFAILPNDRQGVQRNGIGSCCLAFIDNDDVQATDESRHILGMKEESKGCAPTVADELDLPLAALDHFLSVRTACNRERPGSVEIISRGSSKIPKYQEIDIEVYTSSVENNCIVAIVCKGQSVSLSELNQVFGVSSICLAEADELVSCCGFTAGSIPPLGHYSKMNMHIVIDQDLLLLCQSEDLRLLGNGGYAYWQCLVDPETMVSLPNIHIAAIALTGGRIEGIDEHPTNVHTVTTVTTTSEGPPQNDLSSPRPFLEANLPTMNIASLVVQQRDLSNPLTPSLVTIKGKIWSVERKGKRNAIYQLLPITDDCAPGPDTDDCATPLPWKSKSGERMAVRLNVGKGLIQKFGTTHVEAVIDRLREGIVVQAEARMNVGSRDALANWVNNKTIELMVTDYQIFTSDGAIDEHTCAIPCNTKKNHPKSHEAVPILPVLTLEDVFNVSVSVQIVDSLESLESFARDFETLRLFLDEAGASMVGVDCEWQPDQLVTPGDSRPVVLLQLSFHSLGKVYLLDFQTIFRPMLHQGEPMNELEKQASDILSKLWSSERILKVGYQLSSDLRRVVASYPHVPCFRTVNSVLEVDKLCKKILHMTKQKKSRSITMSLGRMTSHYLGRTVDKRCQISDWKARPLSDAQKVYAALDAAVAPALAEMALSCVNAEINPQIPRIERWEGDEELSKAIDSLRFFVVEIEEGKPAKKLQAKQILGDHWIATQTWIAGETPPPSQ